MDDESGESTEEDDVTGVGRGRSEIKRLRWGWWREAGSWCRDKHIEKAKFH